MGSHWAYDVSLGDSYGRSLARLRFPSALERNVEDEEWAAVFVGWKSGRFSDEDVHLAIVGKIEAFYSATAFMPHFRMDEEDGLCARVKKYANKRREGEAVALARLLDTFVLRIDDPPRVELTNKVNYVGYL